jgi:hypothetical protein
MAIPPAHLKDASFADLGNNACVVRVYPGKNAHVRQPSARPQKFSTLRNFKLHLNQMVDLGLDVDMFAIIMATLLQSRIVKSGLMPMMLNLF